MVHILYRLELDWMENNSSAAAHYEPIGVITDPKVAEQLATINPVVDPEECWALSYWKRPIFHFQVKPCETINGEEMLGMCSHEVRKAIELRTARVQRQADQAARRRASRSQDFDENPNPT